MKFAQLNKIFTDEVADKIANGYTICANTMGGHQGEFAKVNFIKDGKHYSLVMNTESAHIEGIMLEKIVIKFVMSNNLKGSLGDRTFCPLYLGDEYVTTIYSRRFWKVKQNADWYVESEDEARAITETIKEHWRHSENNPMWHVLNNSKGFKAVAAAYKKYKARRGASLSPSDIMSAWVEQHFNGLKELVIIRKSESANLRVWLPRFKT